MTLVLKIVFVCAGNVCRSPMAEALLKEKFEQRGVSGIQVSSCGLDEYVDPSGTCHPELAHLIGSAHRQLRNFRSRPTSDKIVHEADLVLTMEDWYVREIASMWPEARGKVATLTGFAGEEGEVIDFDNLHGSFLEWLRSCYVTG